MNSAEPQRILKANALRALGAKVVFNYDDIQRRCEEHVEQVRRQTRQMIEDAQAEAQTIRQQAFEEARAAGREEGCRDAAREIRRGGQELAERLVGEKLATVLPALKSAADALAEERDRWLAAWETAAVGLSVRIAEKLLRRELSAHPEAAVGMVREALQLAAGSSEIRLRLHPDDLALLGDDGTDVVRHLASCSAARLIADADVSRGGCVVETRHGLIDARIETQLERIASELLQREG